MKRVILPILLMLLPILASAETVEINGIWYNLVSKAQEAEVTKNPNIDQYSGSYSGSIKIPTSVTYENVIYSVTSIGEGAFQNCTKLTSVIIPEGVTVIKNEAFRDCYNLTSIEIPSSVRSITGDVVGGAFCNCTSLKTIVIPNGMISIGNFVFKGCTSLESVSLPNSLNAIGQSAFYGCTALTSIFIPNSVTTIDSFAFYGCTALTSIFLSDNLTNLSFNMFRGCVELTSITIPASVTSIGDCALSKCDKLSDVYCKSEQVNTRDYGQGLYTNPNAFDESYPEYITLHVPAASVEEYRAIEPWRKFKDVKPLTDGDIPNQPKCAKPTVSIVDGKIQFGCETEGVEYISDIIVSDAKTYYDATIYAPKSFKVIVYATKAGYENSEKTTELFDFSSETSKSGDVDGNGEVNVADHVKLSNIIMNK